MLMVMFVNHLMAVMILPMNRSVIFMTVLRGVSFCSVDRPMTIIMFLVMTPGVLIRSAAIVRSIRVSVAPGMFSAEMLVPDLFRMPDFSAIRPGCTCK